MAVDNAKVVPLWPSSVSEKWRRNDCFIVSLLINCCMFCNVVLAPLYIVWRGSTKSEFHFMSLPARSFQDTNFGVISQILLLPQNNIDNIGSGSGGRGEELSAMVSRLIFISLVQDDHPCTNRFITRNLYLCPWPPIEDCLFRFFRQLSYSYYYHHCNC